VLKVREPGGTELGERLRQWLLTPGLKDVLSPLAELCLFLAARAQHVHEVILPALKDGKVVLCDRFNDSTVAYQGAGRGLGMAYVRDLCDKICGDVQPDITLYLDVKPELGLTRSRRVSKVEASAGQLDRIEAESIAFHERIREAFLQMCKDDVSRVHLIDAHQSRERVFEQVWDRLQPCL
jgi:dTMP kinase